MALGKTTLLSILAGSMPPDSGIVSHRKDITIGYLDQQPDLNDALTVMEVVLAGESAQLDAVRAYELALAHDDHAALERAMSDMEKLEAWDYETQIRQILGELGIQDVEQSSWVAIGWATQTGCSGARANSKPRLADSGRANQPP
jgi:ATP-binding cassette subfamily F protein uup